MNEQDHGQHMQQMIAGIQQILEIAQQMGAEPIVQIASQLLQAEQSEQASEQPKANFRERLKTAYAEREKNGAQPESEAQ